MATVFVERNEQGRIVGLYANQQPGYAEEELADDHPDVQAFRDPPPDARAVVAERERRLALGFDYDFGDERGIHRIGTTEADLKGWDEVSKVAQAAINLGAPSTEIAIVTDTGPVAVTALEWQMILAAAGAHRQPIWTASFVLQAMDPIPADYTNNSYWT